MKKEVLQTGSPLKSEFSIRVLVWSQVLVLVLFESLALALPVFWTDLPRVEDYVTWAGLWLLWMGFYKKVYIQRWPFWAEMLNIIQAACFLGIVANVFTDASVIHRALGAVELALVMVVAIVLARTVGRLFLSMFGVWGKPTLIFGSGANAIKAYRALQSEPWMGFRVVRFLDLTSECEHHAHLPDVPCTPWAFNAESNSWRDLAPFQCVIALESYQHGLRDQLLMRLAQHKISDVHVIPSLSGIPLFGAKATHFFSHDVLSLSLSNNLSKPSLSLIKRIFDIIAASVALVLVSPLMLWIVWRIWREDGGPVIFSQTRIGRSGQPFKFYKFRSMVKNAEHVIHQWEINNTPEWQTYVGSNFKLSDDPRVLRVGNLIRKSSMDELPQLFNVLLGDMSLVGPRPLMPRELPQYGEELALYGLVRPGITGLWQVSGRSATTFGDRIAFDDWYIKNWSLWGDIAILFKTVKVVFFRLGAY